MEHGSDGLGALLTQLDTICSSSSSSKKKRVATPTMLRYTEVLALYRNPPPDALRMFDKLMPREIPYPGMTWRDKHDARVRSGFRSLLERDTGSFGSLIKAYFMRFYISLFHALASFTHP